MSHDRNTTTISVSFRAVRQGQGARSFQGEDAELLHWLYDRPEGFSEVVRRILREAMAAEAGRSSPQAGLGGDPPGLVEIEAAVERVMQRALARVQVAAVVAEAEPEPGDLAELETNLAGLF